MRRVAVRRRAPRGSDNMEPLVSRSREYSRERSDRCALARINRAKRKTAQPAHRARRFAPVEAWDSSSPTTKGKDDGRSREVIPFHFRSHPYRTIGVCDIGEGGRRRRGREGGLKFPKTRQATRSSRARAHVLRILFPRSDVGYNKTETGDTPRFHVTTRESDVLSMHYQ